MLTRFGCIITPLFATALATSAICIGVAVTVLWPIPDLAISPLYVNLGNVLLSIINPFAGTCWLNPNPSAVFINLEFPRSIASVPYTTLLETTNAFFKSKLPYDASPELWSSFPPPSNFNTPLSVKVLSWIPGILSSALAVVTTLNVDPGGYCPWIALFISGLCSASPALAFFISSAKLLGLKLGFETIANTFPVLGSNATTAPLSSPNAL